jgi:hypothetical protein
MVGKIVEFVGRVNFVSPDGASLRVFVEAAHVSLRTGRREATADFHFVFHSGPEKMSSAERAGAGGGGDSGPSTASPVAAEGAEVAPSATAAALPPQPPQVGPLTCDETL